MDKVIKLPSEKDTIALAHEIAKDVSAPTCIALFGNLGTGKTTFARAFIQSLVGEDTIVPSPTFTIVQTYETAKGEIAHFDLYRLSDPDELTEIDFEEYTQNEITLIEWPEIAMDYLPKKRIEIHLSIENGTHIATIKNDYTQ